MIGVEGVEHSALPNSLLQINHYKTAVLLQKYSLGFCYMHLNVILSFLISLQERIEFSFGCMMPACSFVC